jgi:hypothetical protein
MTSEAFSLRAGRGVTVGMVAGAVTVTTGVVKGLSREVADAMVVVERGRGLEALDVVVVAVETGL